ncbi:M12 family metallopeptidase [Anatilimnocola floriformis]|uniref:M12 family metallopeptidase n=1 Tax=Anatilimnocola floriformis TaxID=2948575 RepID=UPI0020C5295A|nr:M12 family metallopeptidase [Anatilimnocola floriformis]
MNNDEKARRLKEMLQQITGGNVESLIREPSFGFTEGLESINVANDQLLDESLRSVQKVAQDEDLSSSELFGLEAIILPRERPVVFVTGDSYGPIPTPWTHFDQQAIRKNIEAAIPSVGRIELPDNPMLPFGGTGFVVGDNLLMTNRHVGELFAVGLGLRNLAFKAGQSAAVDFKREFQSAASVNLRVREVVMIHPFWDMALLRVDGLPAGHGKLRLSIRTPEELDGREIAVIGYPAQDARNDFQLQNQIFGGVFNVKRLHPGRIRARAIINSFGNSVNAMTHDSSTLGGNSGSAVLDVMTGEIVGLHFAGIYLKANYCVPTYELARDSRVVAAGVNFVANVAATDEWLAAWRLADPESPALSPAGDPPATTPPVKVEANAPTPPTASAPTIAPITSTIVSGPLKITVTVETLAPKSTQVESIQADAVTTGLEGLQEPIIAGRLNQRKGYQPDFLGLNDDEVVPLPTLTAAGKRMAAKLDDDSVELKYHKFSVVMHKKRRLAMFTAANVDWRKSSRLIDGKKPTRNELTGLPEGTSEKWVTDPRIPEDQQLPDIFFTDDNQAWDKGHLIRREDVCWGKTLPDIRKANGDTFHTTNCSPQTAIFNRSNKGDDNWGDLENMVAKQAGSELLCIFAGPVLRADDQVFRVVDDYGEVRIQIPSSYWKIIVAKGPTGPQAFGFVLEQDLSESGLEFIVPEEWQPFTKPIAEIEAMLGGLFKLTWFKKYDQHGLEAGDAVNEGVVAGSGLESQDAPAAPRAYVETADSLSELEVAEGYIHGETFQNRLVKFSVLENRAIFEGDIDLGSLTEIAGDPESGLEGLAITGTRFRWPHRQIPYTIDPALPNQQRVTDAIDEWHNKTQIRFVARTNQADFVTFRPGGGCSAAVGRQGGQQFVTLGPNCTTGNAIHEMGHVVGLWHEQSRKDRDQFVTIDFANVQTNMAHNFLQHVTDGDDIGAYDYGSIMHYPWNAFAKNPALPTIRTPHGEPIGQRTGLSAGDIAAVAALYP